MHNFDAKAAPKILEAAFIMQYYSESLDGV